MKTIQNNLIIIPFNTNLTDDCNYTSETLNILGKHNTVVAIALADIVTLKDICKYFIKKSRKIVLIDKKFNSLIIHPFFIIPGQRFMFIRSINYLLCAVLVRLYISFLGKYKKRLIWFFEPFNIPLFLKVFFDYTSIYDCVDYFPDFSKYAYSCEQKILPKVSFIFANSNILTKKIKRYRTDVQTVPLGLTVKSFRKNINKQSKIIKKKQITIGYIGKISMRLDMDLIKNILISLPMITFKFVGPLYINVFEKDDFIKKFQTLKKFSNFDYVGNISKQQVLTMISSFDICQIPYNVHNNFNKYSFPMKIMEYFYMGKPVISTPIEELKRFPKYVKIGKTVPEWENHIKNILSKPWPLNYQKEQRKIAINNNWNNKINQISKIIS